MNLRTVTPIVVKSGFRNELAIITVKVLLGTLLLALSSWISIPWVPVPVTMQTYIVLLIGAFYGARMGAITVLAWLGEACIGLPVLEGGACGVVPFMGPTGGYLAGFVLAAWVVGWLSERNGLRTVTRAFFSMLLGHIIILITGVTGLAGLIGWNKAFLFGVLPFLNGSILKILFAVSTVRLLSDRSRS